MDGKRVDKFEEGGGAAGAGGGVKEQRSKEGRDEGVRGSGWRNH
jgi:hypothetical protein